MLSEIFKNAVPFYKHKLYIYIYIYIYIYNIYIYQIININLVSKQKIITSQWIFYCQGVHRGLIIFAIINLV